MRRRRVRGDESREVGHQVMMGFREEMKSQFSLTGLAGARKVLKTH